MEKIIDLIPPHWRPYLLAAAWLGPYVLRAGHALYNGTGLVGAVKGVLFGTNTPQPQAAQTQPGTVAANLK